MQGPLSKATKLGEAVNGTSNGSIYVCCLMAPYFNMAIRNNGNVLSIRVEPTTEQNLPTDLKKLGFGGNNLNEYLSQHFKCEGGPLSLCGAYGAIVEQVKFIFGGNAIKALLWDSVQDIGL